MALMSKKNQIWINPFGVFPHMAVVFPVGFGITVNLPPVGGSPVSAFEMEAGVAGCSGPISRKPEPESEEEEEATAADVAVDGAAAANSTANVTAPAKKKKKKKGVNMYGATLDVAGLDRMQCLGERYPPTVIKVAIAVDLAKGAFGLQAVLRNIYLSRIIMVRWCKLTSV